MSYSLGVDRFHLLHQLRDEYNKIPRKDWKVPALLMAIRGPDDAFRQQAPVQQEPDAVVGQLQPGVSDKKLFEVLPQCRQPPYPLVRDIVVAHEGLDVRNGLERDCRREVVEEGALER